MTASLWERAAQLFERALGVAVAERDAFLEQEAGSDNELLARVRAMLEVDAQPSPLLDATPDELAALVVAETPMLEGKRVGPYTIRSVIGRGGMGIVCLAVREDVGKEVALKLVAGGLGSPERIGRFLLERRLLAQLEHPNIAGFLDAGLADDGTPWLALEYIAGQPIDQYADDQALGVVPRLGLFEKTARAIGFAHRHLIVHRDIKPSNVLVAEDGEPQLLDFGIAKLLDEPDAATVTDAIGARMTPQYASPEQIRGEPITTSADVYQLGALLFELLTGARPHPSRTVRSQALSLEPVARPSLAVDEARAARRGLSAAALRRALAGDLDTIVAKATALDPRERYATTEQLADDVRRHLDGLPVVARPATAAYRLRKLVARHRAATALISTALTAILGFAVTVQVKNRRIESERERAEQVATLLADLFAGANPDVAQGERITVRAVLDRGAARVRADSAIAPAVKARLLEVIADSYEGIGKPDVALTLQTEAVGLWRITTTPRHPARLGGLRRLGTLLANLGKGVEAYAPLEEALTEARALGRDRRLELAGILHAVGYAHQSAGDRAVAETRYQEALAIHQSLPEPGDPAREAILVNIAFLADSRGEAAAAEQYFRDVLERRRVRLGSEHSLTAKSMLDLANLLARSSRVDEAEILVRQAIAIQQLVFQEPNREQILGFGALAQVLNARGKPQEAEAAQRQALELTRQVFGDSSSNMALSAANLAAAVQRNGRLDEAAELHRDAIRRYQAFYGMPNVSTAVTITNLAWTERLRGSFAVSESLYRQAIPVLDSAWTGTGRLSSILVDFGIVLGFRNHHQQAAVVLRRALAIAEQGKPPNQGDVIRAKGFLGVALTTLGRYAEAESLLVDAHRWLVANLGATNQYTVIGAANLARLYERWGRSTDAARFRIKPD